MGRWSSDAISAYIAGMILDVHAENDRPSQASSGISIMRMDTQLVQRLCSMEAKMGHLLALGARSDFVVGRRSAGETTAQQTSVNIGTDASTVAGSTASKVRVPAVAVVSLKQETRAKLHLAPHLLGRAGSWKTWGCRFKFGESKFSVHALTELETLKFERCKFCFAEPFFNPE